MQFDVSSKECIRVVSNFGSSTYQNICDDTSTVVPWGTMDYFLGLSVILMMAFAVIMIGAMSASLWRDLRRGYL